MKVLLIEDNPGDADLVRKALHSANLQQEVTAFVRLHDALSQHLDSFDIALADLSLPDSSGLTGLKKLRKLAPKLPVVVLTSLDNDALAVEAIKEGAQDYIVKDQIDSDVLERSIRHAIERQRMQTENDQLLQDVQTSKVLLEQKNQRLQRLCETAQQFVDNVSHEFRTPLTVIMEYASLINDGVAGAVTAQQQELLSIIDDRACDLNTMVDDMLDVSKLESGLLGVGRRSWKLVEIVEHTLPALQRKAAVRGVRLETKVDPALPDVFCDEEKVGRIIVNLAVNAIKFARDPGEVTIWAKKLDETEIQIGVSDNGPGIPQDKLHEIFQRFSQVQTELRQSTKGFGLGLNIARELVELNFGRMDLTSQLDVGSTFTFTLPIADSVNVTRKYLDWLPTREKSLPAISVVSLSVAKDVSDDLVEDVETFLYGVLRQHDVVFRSGSNEWLLLVNTPEVEFGEFQQRLLREHLEVNRNLPTEKLPTLHSNFERAWQLDCTKEIVDFVASKLNKEVCCV